MHFSTVALAGLLAAAANAVPAQNLPRANSQDFCGNSNFIDRIDFRRERGWKLPMAKDCKDLADKVAIHGNKYDITRKATNIVHLRTCAFRASTKTGPETVTMGNKDISDILLTALNLRHDEELAVDGNTATGVNSENFMLCGNTGSETSRDVGVTWTIIHYDE